MQSRPYAGVSGTHGVLRMPPSGTDPQAEGDPRHEGQRQPRGHEHDADRLPYRLDGERSARLAEPRFLGRHALVRGRPAELDT
jgi:hypothetical protein